MQYIYLIAVILTFSVIDHALGHGYVHNVVANNMDYPGWNPFNDPYIDAPARIVRKVINDGYVDTSDPDLACHHEGNNGTTALADAPAGSQVTFQWAYWPSDHQGPVSTYMALCTGGCATFQANTALWFKIDASGYDPTTKLWAADNLRANNNSWTSTIPASLAPGQYLIRNEIVALHSSAPQFYPSCSQINVSGKGSSQASASDLVLMQTLYNGVTWPDIYSNFGSFTIPGPPPVNFAGNAGPQSSLSQQVTTSAPTSASNTTSSPPVSTSQPSKNCLLSSRRLIRRN